MDVNRDPLASFQTGQTQGGSGLEVTYLMHLHSQQITTLSGLIVCLLTKPCYYSAKLHHCKGKVLTATREGGVNASLTGFTARLTSEKTKLLLTFLGVPFLQDST